MSGTQVFLSYVDDTKPFVDEFSRHFFSLELDLQHLDRTIDAGEVERDELAKRIDAADIFIAFIGSTYEKDCANELDRRASLRKRIVPITLSQGGKIWWDDFKKSHSLDIKDQAFFQPGSSNWDTPDAQLVVKIRNALLEPVVPVGPIVSLKQMILLGHPKAELSDGVRQAADQLTEEMKASGATVTAWPNKWCDPDKEAALNEGALFVQPLSAADAPAYMEQPGRTLKYLSVALAEKSRPVLEKSQIMLWLPKGEQHEDFGKRAETEGEANPAFRIDTPSELSHVLARLLGRDKRGPVLTLESVDEPGNGAAEVRRKLPEEIFGCVRKYLPEENTYVEFPPSEFELLFGDIAGQRPILVAHDLKASANVMIGNGDPRQQILAKFTDVQVRADKILQAKGLRTEDVFWVACISNGRHGLPRSPHLPTFHLRRWIILELEYAGERFVPEEQSRKRLDNALGTWAQSA
ncbi:TIR domain-containing protein [Nordella sp. HKS 07]|uniref:TIR domain-containing protein n=1 Tax=Nordella sp. HKS 07 TaxID=2712222 RepID=UPI0013E0EAF6|nr:TIR domain-containing protein [Nordella sp. HKS 07]QIG50605.1 TIR domain-containing protein [Nordella sp. HKS 07]